MDNYLLISDAAKEVQVESHVLRYWEEELRLPIRRNELGHRYYTREDVELFKQIKVMKERGLQLKAIKMILKDGKLDVMTEKEEEITENLEHDSMDKSEDTMAIRILENHDMKTSYDDEREEKARRLQWLLQQMIQESLQENNKALCMELKDSVIKELDYQFRAQEEREEEREQRRIQRDEEHYQKLDVLLRNKSKKIRKNKRTLKETAIQSVKEEDDITELKTEKVKESKKKRHFIF